MIKDEEKTHLSANEVPDSSMDSPPQFKVKNSVTIGMNNPNNLNSNNTSKNLEHKPSYLKPALKKYNTQNVVEMKHFPDKSPVSLKGSINEPLKFNGDKMDDEKDFSNNDAEEEVNFIEKKEGESHGEKEKTLPSDFLIFFPDFYEIDMM